MCVTVMLNEVKHLTCEWNVFVAFMGRIASDAQILRSAQDDSSMSLTGMR